MFDELGLSFLPGANGPRSEAGPGGGRLEDVLRILSFRLPKVLGAKAIAPGELLNSPGGSALPSGGGSGGDPIADIISRTVLQNLPGSGGGAANPAGSFAPGMPGGGSAPPMPAPKPRIIPIEDPPFGGGGQRDTPERPFSGELEDIDAQLQPGRRRPRFI